MMSDSSAETSALIKNRTAGEILPPSVSNAHLSDNVAWRESLASLEKGANCRSSVSGEMAVLKSTVNNKEINKAVVHVPRNESCNIKHGQPKLKINK